MAPKRKTRSSNTPARSANGAEELDRCTTPATMPMAPAADAHQDVPLLEPLPMPALAAKASTSSDTGAASTASTADDLSSLECPICYSYMQPPFLACVNAHPVCTDCKKTGQLDKCPICRVGIEDDALKADPRLETLAACVELPCSNGCGQKLPYLSARVHERTACALAPRNCPMRGLFAYGADGWSTAGPCECRGIDVSDPHAMREHLMRAHSLAEQLPDKERSSTWTIKLPAAALFETGIFSEPLAEAWGKPALHRWEPTILSRREDGKKFLAQVVAARHAGVSLLLFGLTPSAEGMYLTAEVQAPQEGVAPPYVWQSRVLGTDALKADASAADEARLLRRCVAFPEAAAEFCRDAHGEIKISLTMKDEDDDDSEAGEMFEDMFQIVWDGEGEEGEEGEFDDDDDGEMMGGGPGGGPGGGGPGGGGLVRGLLQPSDLVVGPGGSIVSSAFADGAFARRYPDAAQLRSRVEAATAEEERFVRRMRARRDVSQAELRRLNGIAARPSPNGPGDDGDDDGDDEADAFEADAMATTTASTLEMADEPVGGALQRRVREHMAARRRRGPASPRSRERWMGRVSRE